MIDQSLDPNLVAEKATEIAAQKMEEMKQDLARTIAGKTDQDAPPESWGTFRGEIAQTKEEAISAARAAAKEVFEEERKAQTQKQEQTLSEQQEQLTKEYNQVVSEYRDAVADGLMPAINPAVQKRIDEKVSYSDLTPDEQKDPGLIAYQKAFALHNQLKRDGKTSSFYRTVQKFGNQPPAGAYAPVFGNVVATQEPQDDYTYEEIRANRKAKLGF